MEIMQQSPLIADFYELYINQKKNKDQSNKDDIFLKKMNQKNKRFQGYDQFLYSPERKIIHKNYRFIRFEDIDMGEEIEAALYNDGRKAQFELKNYVND